MNNSDEMMLEYLLQMQSMLPEQQQMTRRQAMVDALRKQSMTPLEGQMVGRHYVAPHLGQYLAQLGTGYLAGQGQKAQDAAFKKMTEDQRAEIEKIRNRVRMGQQGNMSLMTPTMPTNPMMQYGAEGYE